MKKSNHATTKPISYRNRRRSVITILLIGFITVISTVMFLCFRTSENIVDHLIEIAKEEVNIHGVEHLPVKLNSETFEIGGREYFYFSKELKKGEEIPVLEVEIPNQLKENFDLSKKLVRKFVNQYFDSKTEKEILTQMEEIPFVIGDFSICQTTSESSFIFDRKKMYMNPEILDYWQILPNELIIFTMVHEWVHMVREVTFSEDIALMGIFPEAMTDIIAKAIYDYDREDPGSYKESYYYAYAFVSKYEEEAIRAYFYGFSSIMEKMGEDNFQVLLFITDVMQSAIIEDGYTLKRAYLEVNGVQEQEVKQIVLSIL